MPVKNGFGHVVGESSSHNQMSGARVLHLLNVPQAGFRKQWNGDEVELIKVADLANKV